MNLENIILQGGALAVILSSFILVLRWLLNHFTKSLARIEQSIHVNTMTLIAHLRAHALNGVNDENVRTEIIDCLVKVERAIQNLGNGK